jgi:hypothetical protein
MTIEEVEKNMTFANNKGKVEVQLRVMIDGRIDIAHTEVHTTTDLWKDERALRHLLAYSMLKFIEREEKDLDVIIEVRTW